jgi:hypothetical protein
MNRKREKNAYSQTSRLETPEELLIFDIEFVSLLPVFRFDCEAEIR